jgi:hypothetical protein
MAKIFMMTLHSNITVILFILVFSEFIYARDKLFLHNIILYVQVRFYIFIICATQKVSEMQVEFLFTKITMLVQLLSDKIIKMREKKGWLLFHFCFL